MNDIYENRNNRREVMWAVQGRNNEKFGFREGVKDIARDVPWLGRLFSPVDISTKYMYSSPPLSNFWMWSWLGLGFPRKGSPDAGRGGRGFTAAACLVLPFSSLPTSLLLLCCRSVESIGPISQNSHKYSCASAQKVFLLRARATSFSMYHTEYLPNTLPKALFFNHDQN